MKAGKIRKAALGALAAGAMIAGVATVTAGPAHATTTLYIKSFEGSGNYLETGGNSGQNVYFSHSITSIAQWDFNIQGNGQYYMHPHGKTGCLTVVTTGTPYLKIEGCVGAFNQYFRDPSFGGSYMVTNDGYSGKALADLTNGNGVIQAQIASNEQGYGVNGVTMQQSAGR